MEEQSITEYSGILSVNLSIVAAEVNRDYDYIERTYDATKTRKYSIMGKVIFEIVMMVTVAVCRNGKW